MLFLKFFMSLENPEKIVKFPKIKRVGDKFDKQTLQKAIEKNFLPSEELEADEEEKVRKFGRKAKKARMDLGIIKG